MGNDVYKPPRAVPTPLDGSWGREAARVRGPLSGLGFRLRARANKRALEMAGEHAQAVGKLMDIAVETMEKMQRAQDRAREFQVREAHHGDLCANESEQLLDQLAEQRHRREMAEKRRQAEQINAETEILAAQQAMRAKKKFERLKHRVGEARFKTEAARRKVGAAEAEMAMREPGQEAPKAAAPENGMSKAAAVSEMLQEVRAQLQAMRADGEDSDERRALVEEEAALERLLAKLLKR